MLSGSTISTALIIDPSILSMVKIRGIYGLLDFVAYKTKYGDESPIADIYSKVST